jgi:Arc/MetJ-type ribon-helix-helix transcriptional regulator
MVSDYLEEIRMSYTFPPDVAKLIQEQMESGAYSSEDDVLRVALTVLGQYVSPEDDTEYHETLAAVREGHADAEAGRVTPLRTLIEEFRQRQTLE